MNIIIFNKPNQGAGCTHSLPHCQKTHISLYHGLAISSNVLTGTLLKIRACGDNYLIPGLSQEGDEEKEFRQRLHGTMMPLVSQEDGESKFSGDQGTTSIKS